MAIANQGYRSADFSLEQTHEMTRRELLESWQIFYRDVFGIGTDFSILSVPKTKKNFSRGIVVDQAMTPQRIYDRCLELFSCWRGSDEDFDEIIQSDRTNKDGPYVVWFQDVVEADEDLKNLSADDLKNKDIPGITLEERLLMELKYFKKTGQHLDVDNVTLCAGSRNSFGLVPSVCWLSHDRRIRIYWHFSKYFNIRLRSRRAVR